MAWCAGPRRCAAERLPAVLGLAGGAIRADAALVRRATGFALGGVAPLAHNERLPIAIDASLGRFEVLWAAAGHPHCVFATTLEELQRITAGVLSDEISI